MTLNTLKSIFSRTSGHCHDTSCKRSAVSHKLHPGKQKDGKNSLRAIHELPLPPVIIATGEIRMGTETGKRILELKEKRGKENKKRRTHE
jgi:hypothetical protein